jgi:hypothetical protein
MGIIKKFLYDLRYILGLERRCEVSLFEEYLENSPEVIQAMADKGDILDKDKIKLCLEQGIKFEKEFLEEMDCL